MARTHSLKPGPGRPKGVPNKVTTELRQMVLGALDAVGGQTYLEQHARETPQAFLTLVGRCLPKDIKVEGEGLHITLNLLGRQ